jgi:hypothetical protein
LWIIVIALLLTIFASISVLVIIRKRLRNLFGWEEGRSMRLRAGRLGLRGEAGGGVASLESGLGAIFEVNVFIIIGINWITFIN